MLRSLGMRIFIACTSFIFFTQALSDPIFTYTHPKKILRLYQLLKDVHELCEVKRIEYWIDCGTLLGALRHRGIIPWDTNVDICVNIRHEHLLKELKPFAKKLGYRFTYAPDIGYRITSKDVFLDICTVETIGDKTYYQREYMRKIAGYGKRGRGPLYYTREELYPLKRYKFGEIHVWGPQNPHPYLNAYYGDSWPRYARMLLNHNHNIWSPKEVKLSETEMVPAQPTGPLGNRVENLFMLNQLDQKNRVNHG